MDETSIARKGEAEKATRLTFDPNRSAARLPDRHATLRPSSNSLEQIVSTETPQNQLCQLEASFRQPRNLTAPSVRGREELLHD